MEITFTDANFKEEVLDSQIPVAVDFWAPWCGPCKITGPIIEKLAHDFAGKGIKIGKMNVDENQATSQNYGIMSIPTILLFKGGKVVEQIVGTVPESGLKAKFEELMK